MEKQERGRGTRPSLLGAAPPEPESTQGWYSSVAPQNSHQFCLSVAVGSAQTLAIHRTPEPCSWCSAPAPPAAGMQMFARTAASAGPGSRSCRSGQSLGLTGESLDLTSGGDGCAEYKEQWGKGGRCERPGSLPFVVTELVAVVVRRDDVDQQDVLGLGVHACDFYLVAGEHPPGGGQGGRWRHEQSTRRDGSEWARGQKDLRGAAPVARGLGSGQSPGTL